MNSKLQNTINEIINEDADRMAEKLLFDNSAVDCKLKKEQQMSFEERMRQPIQHYVQHTVKAMDKSLVQRCELCGEIISDYRTSVWPEAQEPPTGFPEGSVFITTGNPQYLTIILNPEDTFESCVKHN